MFNIWRLFLLEAFPLEFDLLLRKSFIWPFPSATALRLLKLALGFRNRWPWFEMPRPVSSPRSKVFETLFSLPPL